MIVGSVICLQGSLRGHRHCSSFEDHLGTAVGPDVYVVNFSAYIEIKDFRLAFGFVPICVGHGHFAHTHVLSAKPPAVILLRLNYDNVLSFLVLHLDIGNCPFKVNSIRVYRVFNIDPLTGADPLIPSGQKTSVIKIKLVLDEGLPYVDLPFSKNAEWIPFNLCTYTHFYTAYSQLLQLCPVDIEIAKVLVNPTGFRRILSIGAFSFKRQYIIFLNFCVNTTFPNIITCTVIEQRVLIIILDFNMTITVIKMIVLVPRPLFPIFYDGRVKSEVRF